VANLVTRETLALDRALDEPVATLRFALVGEGAGELPMGRLMADAVRGAGRSRIGIIPSSVLRFGLPGGTLRLRHLYERLPFPTPLVTVTVTGETLVTALDSALATSPLMVHVSGITVRYDAKRRAGDRIREVRLEGGDRIDPKQTYAVTVPLSLLDLRPFAGFRDAPQESLGVTDRQALRRYLGLLRQPVEAPAAERVVITR